MASLTLIQGEAASVDDRVRAVVRVLLAAADMKPVDLAERLGLSKHQVWDRLRGDKVFSVAEVAAMAALFEVPVQAFVAGPSALINARANPGREAVSIKNRAAPPGVSHPSRPTGRLLHLVAA